MCRPNEHGRLGRRYAGPVADASVRTYPRRLNSIDTDATLRTSICPPDLLIPAVSVTELSGSGRLASLRCHGSRGDDATVETTERPAVRG